jgi:hypothetical protein
MSHFRFQRRLTAGDHRFIAFLVLLILVGMCRNRRELLPTPRGQAVPTFTTVRS